MNSVLPPSKPRKPAKSLHLQILEEVREKIVSGAWPPGFRIPFEVDMAQHYGCSRMTVNKALTQLTQAGLLDRTRKSGTFVRVPSSISAALDITNIQTEVERTGKAYAHRILDDTKRTALAEDLAKLRQEKPCEVRGTRCLHLADDLPFCVEDRLINLRAVPAAEEADFTAIPPGAWLLKTVPWNAAEHRISAQSATGELARLLDIADGSACLVIQRTTQNDEGAVTWAKLRYAGDTHALFARFTPSQTAP